MGVIIITSCSTDESVSLTNTTTTEKNVIQKSSEIEDEALKELEDQFNLLQVGNDFDATEIDSEDETTVYGSITLKVLCKYWNLTHTSFVGYGVDAGGQYYLFYSVTTFNFDPIAPWNSTYDITVYSYKVSKPNC